MAPFDNSPLPSETTQGPVIRDEVEIFSLRGLRDWLRTQEPATTYPFLDCGGDCLFGRYLAARGRAWSLLDYMQMGNERRFLVAADKPHTYGAALSRCEKALEGMKG